MEYFGSKATSGLCQALIALMPPHSVYIESHLGGGALMKRKPTGVRSIGIDRDAQALEAFACDYPVELVHGCAHAFLASFPFLGPDVNGGAKRDHRGGVRRDHLAAAGLSP